MFVPNPNSEDREFPQADEQWYLDRLLQDIYKATQENLTLREQRILRGLLSDYGPGEIARMCFSNPNSKAISKELGNIYDRIEVLLSKNPINYDGDITSDNIRRLLQQAEYRKS